MSLVINDNTDLLENGAILRIQRTGRDEFVQSENIPVFPAEMTLTSETEGDADLIIDALSGGEVLARARVAVTFARSIRSPIDVELQVACEADPDCNNNLVCDGSERCDDGVCVAGTPPSEDDGNPCTIVTCSEPTGVLFTDVVDGDTCNADGSVCISGVCSVSVCGDGFIDVGRGEQCEDGNQNPNDGCTNCTLTRWVADVLTGLGASAGVPLELPLQPSAIAIDIQGNVYVADSFTDTVFRLDIETDIALRVAGNGVRGGGGDGGQATAAELSSPLGLALDGSGNLYIADTGNHRVRRVNARTGVITTVAGSGNEGFSGDGGPATAAMLNTPQAVAIGPGPTLLVADAGNHRVRSVTDLDSSPIITTVAGTGMAGDELGATALTTDLGEPAAVMFHDDAMLVADRLNGRVIRAEPDGSVALTVELSEPSGIGLSGDMLLVVTDSGSSVTQVDLGTGEFGYFAGNGERGQAVEGAAPTESQFRMLVGVVAAPSGSVYVADRNQRRVFAVEADRVRLLIGNGQRANLREGNSATGAEFVGGLRGLTLSSSGRPVFADTFGQLIFEVDLEQDTITRLAGNGTNPDPGDGALAEEAGIRRPLGVWASLNGDVYFSDAGQILRLSNETLSVVAGTDDCATDLGDSGSPTNATFCRPLALVGSEDSEGRVETLFVADTGNNRVRKIDFLSDTITTIVGGAINLGSDGDLGSDISLSSPSALSLAASGHVYIADSGNFRILSWDPGSETIQIVAGDATEGDRSSEGPAPSTAIPPVFGLHVASNGDVYFGVDRYLKRIRGGQIENVAGSGAVGDGGNGMAPEFAELGTVAGIVTAGSDIFFTDLDLRKKSLHRIDTSSDRIFTVAGWGARAGDGPLEAGTLFAPAALLRIPNSESDFWIADSASGRLRVRLGGSITTLVGAAGGTGQEAAFSRLLEKPAGLAYDQETSSLFISEAAGHTIRRLHLADSPPTVSTFAGELGEAGYEAMNDSAGRFDTPGALHFDPTARSLWVSDSGNSVVRRIDVDSRCSEIVVGMPRSPGTLVDTPTGLVARGESIYIADIGLNQVARIDVTSSSEEALEIVLGENLETNNGDRSVQGPRGIALDSLGNLFVTSSNTIKVVTIGDDGVATRDDAVHIVYGLPPRDTFPQSVTRCLADVEVLPGDDALLVSDECAEIIVLLGRQ